MVTITINCLVVGCEGIGKTSFISKISDQQSIVTFAHEAIIPIEDTSKVKYVIKFIEKDIEPNEQLSYKDLTENQIIIIQYDLQEKISFECIKNLFNQCEPQLREIMMEGYQSEKENKQAFIGWQEDESIEEFTQKIVDSKKKKMIILLGNKCDFDYDSAREVSENEVERFVDKYQDLGMVQSEISVLQDNGVGAVKRTIQFFSQKFLTEQDLINIIKVNEKIQQDQEQQEQKHKVNVPKFGQKKQPKVIKQSKFSEINPKQQDRYDDSDQNNSIIQKSQRSQITEVDDMPPPLHQIDQNNNQVEQSLNQSQMSRSSKIQQNSDIHQEQQQKTKPQQDHQQTMYQQFDINKSQQQNQQPISQSSYQPTLQKKLTFNQSEQYNHSQHYNQSQNQPINSSYKQPFNQSQNQPPINQSQNQPPINQSQNQPPINQSQNQPINQSQNQPINQFYNQPIKQSQYQPINQSYNQPVNQSYNQPISQSYNQPIKQSYNQPINQSYNQQYKPSYQQQNIPTNSFAQQNLAMQSFGDSHPNNNYSVHSNNSIPLQKTIYDQYGNPIQQNQNNIQEDKYQEQIKTTQQPIQKQDSFENYARMTQSSHSPPKIFGLTVKNQQENSTNLNPAYPNQTQSFVDMSLKQDMTLSDNLSSYKLGTKQLLSSQRHQVETFDDNTPNSKISNKSLQNLRSTQNLNNEMSKKGFGNIVDQLQIQQYEQERDDSIEDESYEDEFSKVNKLMGNKQNFSFHQSQQMKNNLQNHYEQSEQSEYQKSEVDQQLDQYIKTQQSQRDSYNYQVNGPKLIYQTDLNNLSEVQSEQQVQVNESGQLTYEEVKVVKQMIHEKSQPERKSIGTTTKEDKMLIMQEAYAQTIQLPLPIPPKYPNIQQLLGVEGMPQFPKIQRLEETKMPQQLSRQTDNLNISISPKPQKQNPRKQPLLVLQFDIHQSSFQLPVYYQDDTQNLAQKLLKKLNLEEDITIQQKLQKIIEDHLTHYTDKINFWINDHQLPKTTFESVKWKAFIHKNPDFLQEIEDEYQIASPNLNNYLFPQVKKISLADIHQKTIGLIHVELDSETPVGSLQVKANEEPINAVNEFLKQHKINDATAYKKLYQEYTRIQKQQSDKDLRSKTPRSKSPTLQGIRILDFEMNQNDAYINSLIGIGKERKERLRIQRNENVKKCLEKFAIKNKLNQSQISKLQGLIEEQIRQHRNKKV